MLDNKHSYQIVHCILIVHSMFVHKHMYLCVYKVCVSICCRIVMLICSLYMYILHSMFLHNHMHHLFTLTMSVFSFSCRVAVIVVLEVGF